MWLGFTRRVGVARGAIAITVSLLVLVFAACSDSSSDSSRSSSSDSAPEPAEAQEDVVAAPTVEQCHDEVNHPAISLSVTNLACNTAFEVFDACNANGCLTQAAGATIQINVGGGTWACDRDFCGGSGTSCVVYGNTPSQQTACGGAFQA